MLRIAICDDDKILVTQIEEIYIKGKWKSVRNIMKSCAVFDMI